MTWPFGDLRPLSYGCLLVDPPWRFACSGITENTPQTPQTPLASKSPPKSCGA